MHKPGRPRSYRPNQSDSALNMALCQKYSRPHQADAAQIPALPSPSPRLLDPSSLSLYAPRIRLVCSRTVRIRIPFVVALPCFLSLALLLLWCCDGAGNSEEASPRTAIAPFKYSQPQQTEHSDRQQHWGAAHSQPAVWHARIRISLGCIAVCCASIPSDSDAIHSQQTTLVFT